MNFKKHIMHSRYLLMYIRHLIKPLPYYGQLKEDIVVSQLFGKINKFIDIGAYNGITGSNTFLFALKGAKGLCFEPIPDTFFKLSYLYALNKKVRCSNIAISNVLKSVEIRSDKALSVIMETKDSVNEECLSQYIDNNAEIITTQTQTLKNYLRDYPKFLNVDLLSIDVEGHELNVLEGIDFNNFSAKCIIIETLGGASSNYDKIDYLLKQSNYKATITNGLNTFWINQVHAISKDKLDHVVNKHEKYEILT